MPIEIIIEDTLPNKMISAIAKKLEIEEVVNNNEVSITLPPLARASRSCQ